MPRTIAALFDSRADAEGAFHALLEAGVAGHQSALLACREPASPSLRRGAPSRLTTTMSAAPCASSGCRRPTRPNSRRRSATAAVSCQRASTPRRPPAQSRSSRPSIPLISTAPPPTGGGAMSARDRARRSAQGSRPGPVPVFPRRPLCRDWPEWPGARTTSAPPIGGRRSSAVTTPARAPRRPARALPRTAPARRASTSSPIAATSTEAAGCGSTSAPRSHCARGAGASPECADSRGQRGRAWCSGRAR